MLRIAAGSVKASDVIVQKDVDPPSLVSSLTTTHLPHLARSGDAACEACTEALDYRPSATSTSHGPP